MPQTRQMASGTKATSAGIDEVRWVLPNGRASDIIAYEEEMVRFFVDAAGLLGVPKSVAAVYGVVFASPEPLSFSEIAAKLYFSNGSVSQALRVLRELGAVRSTEELDQAGVEKGRAAARERFVPDLELRKLASRFLEQRLEKQLATGSNRLEALKRSLPGGNKYAIEVLNARLNSLNEWHTRAHQLIPVIRALLRIAP